MTVLALDLGTKTGFAMLSDGAIVSGTQDFKTSRYESTAMRFVRFNRFLSTLHENGPITQVVYEEVRRHKGVDAAHAYGGFMAHLLTFCEQREIPVEALSVGDIKRHWTGKGNASKDDMIAAAKRYGYDVKDDNEADALAMLHMTVGDVL